MEIVLILVVLIAGLAAGFFISKNAQKSQATHQSKLPQADRDPAASPTASTASTPVVPPAAPEIENHSLVQEARSKAKEIIIEAKTQALRLKTQVEEEARKSRQESMEFEKKHTVLKAQLDAKEKDLETKSQQLKKIKEVIEKRQEEAEELVKKQQQELEKVANLTQEEAKAKLLKLVDEDLAKEKGKRIRALEEELRRDSDKLSKEILIDAMRFGATDYVVEYTTSKVALPDDDLKGRIIGKEGRNIRIFEELTGVDLDLDSSPGYVLISCFDPVRREIARLALERLIADGRIQPAKIEEIVEKTKKEIEHIMYKEGDNLCHKVGAYNLPKDLIQMLGRFKYRFSYGQNMIEHTLEETRIGIALAHELGADVNVVKMGCLLHDIGKVVTDDEGTHVDLGVELLKKYNIDEAIINCVAEHHEDRPFSSFESALVNLADHISGARPGARSEDYEAYVKRMKDLEAAAMSFDGVEKVYAVSAGREVRVFVSPDKVDDYSTAFLAKEIAKKIELEQTYPGVVKVIVIRETRVSETAR